jgi:hypothetical protein
MIDDREVILRLLKETAAAHGRHEADELGGVFDEEWPEWYSTYLADRLHAEGLRLSR